jgi:hypothetical protein
MPNNEEVARTEADFARQYLGLPVIRPEMWLRVLVGRVRP